MFLFLKKTIFFVIIIVLLIILAYVVNINSIPNNVILFKNSKLSLETISGIKVKEVTNSENKNTFQTSASISEESEKEETKVLRDDNEKKYRVSLFGINLKTVTTNTIDDRKVIPLGNVSGIKLYTKGVLVVGLSEVLGENNKVYKPYEEAGIEQGDNITEINGEKIDSTKELMECVKKCKGKSIIITFVKNGEEKKESVTPVKTDKNKYRLGIWVRDASAGIGTLSFYDELTNSLVSLGHGIQDIDTGEIVEISSGEFVTSHINNILKGKKNEPGKISGTIENGISIGEIYKNTKFGIYGHLESKDAINLDNSNKISIALRDEIKEGQAKIMCTLDNGKTEEYNVNIQKIFKKNNTDNKSMIIKVTDKKLLEKTGGIIQGMSGSPIIQNGKLIGVLTHVLVSDPTSGYGVFADLMVNELR